MQIEIETQELETKALSLPDQAKEIQVIAQESRDRASSMLLTVKALRKQIDETFDPGIKKIHEAHKDALATKRKFEAPLAQAEATIKPRIAMYYDLQEKKRRQEEARLREEARKQAEEDQLAQAVAAEQMGMHAEAENIIQAPVYAPTIIIPKTSQPAQGISMRKTWKYRVVNRDLIPRDYMLEDDKKIGGVVRAMGEQTNIPGIEVYCETGVAARSSL